ncbi:MAG: maleylpyruvate isomerase family mycothiol-dependent enzyme, partial [Jiangellaceae bacterium]
RNVGRARPLFVKVGGEGQDARMDALPLLHTLTAAFERDAVQTPLDTKPTAMKRWSAADLIAHLGAVHRWAAQNARSTTRNHRDNVPAITVPPAEYYAESRSILLDTLDELDPNQRCYTFQSGNKVVRFWHRRQTHETLVHLWDLRSAVDPEARAPAEADPDAYADGIEELFSVFVARAGPAARTPLAGSLGLRAADIDRRWLLHPDWRFVPDAPETATTEVTGTAGDLMLLGWDRLGPASGRFEIEGEPGVLETFLRSRVRP